MESLLAISDDLDLYLGADIYFYILEINYINNTDAFSNDNTYQLFGQNNTSACNVYIVEQMAGVCGYSFVPENWDGSGWSGPNRGGIVLAKNCMAAGNTTYRHEMGHYLNLPHTFYGWEGNTTGNTGNAPNWAERVDGNNCSSAGDQLCDTPPDYLSSGGWQCNSAGMSNTLQKDLNGVDFRSDGSNIMTYANSSCGAKFTPGQISAMRANLLTEKSSYLYNQGMQIDTIIQNITQLHPTPSEVVDLNAVDFVWNKVDKATHYVLQVSFIPTFSTLHAEVLTSDTLVTVNDFVVNRKYYWRVRPFNKGYTCSPISPVQDFTASDLTAVNDVKGVENYRLYPNLIASGQPMNLDIKLTENLNANILIVSSNGQIVRQSNARFSIGQNEYFVATNGLPAGIYILVVQTENGIIRDKFVVGK